MDIIYLKKSFMEEVVVDKKIGGVIATYTI